MFVVEVNNTNCLIIVIKTNIFWYFTVDKMIQCARQSKHIGRKNGGSQYLTFGELCFITRTLQMQKPKHKDIVHQKPQQLQLQPHNENSNALDAHE